MEELRTGTEQLLEFYIPYILLVLQATGDHPSDEDALEMIAEADIDGDGRSNQRENIDFTFRSLIFFCFLVNYDEFVLIMSNNSSSSRK